MSPRRYSVFSQPGPAMSKGRLAIPITRSTSGTRSRAPMKARPISPVGPVTATVSMPRFWRNPRAAVRRPRMSVLLLLQLHGRAAHAGAAHLRLERLFGDRLLGRGRQLDLERRLCARGEAERALADRLVLRLAAGLDL